MDAGCLNAALFDVAVFAQTSLLRVKCHRDFAKNLVVVFLFVVGKLFFRRTYYNIVDQIFSVAPDGSVGASGLRAR